MQIIQGQLQRGYKVQRIDITIKKYHKKQVTNTEKYHKNKYINTEKQGYLDSTGERIW